jgi:hypothetical protein
MFEDNRIGWAAVLEYFRVGANEALRAVGGTVIAEPNGYALGAIVLRFEYRSPKALDLSLINTTERSSI